MGRKSTTSRTKELLTPDGWLCWVVEQWVSVPSHPAKGFRRDLLNCIDMLAMRPNQPPVGIQVTSTGNMLSRFNKIKSMCNEHDGEGFPNPVLWLMTGCPLIIQGWDKLPKNSRRKRPVWRNKAIQLEIDSTGRNIDKSWSGEGLPPCMQPTNRSE